MPDPSDQLDIYDALGSSTAYCLHCPQWYAADTELAVTAQLSRHGALFHDTEPDEVALDVREA